ncbi:hypothetical protein OIU78_018376 [Salix suchowensis]|nr:hypothetical protein OIU78_018376 [Salix suchowensis]
MQVAISKANLGKIKHRRLHTNSTWHEEDRYVPITFSCLAIPSVSIFTGRVHAKTATLFNPLPFKLPLVIFDLNFCFSFEFIKPLATALR